MTLKAIFTVGVSGSGKSTWARDQKGYTVVDRDKIRKIVLKQHDPEYNKKRESLWHYWDWSWEDEVSELELKRVMHHIMMNDNMIICETGFELDNPEHHTSKIIKALTAAGYEISRKYCKIDYDTAIMRDRKRLESVGDHIIDKQWLKWLALPAELTGIRKYKRDTSKPKCIISDIDGTIALHTDRAPYDWSRVNEDLPIQEIIDLVYRYQSSGVQIIFVTGRSEDCRRDTELWLDQHFKHGYKLFMRPSENYLKDRVIKEQIFFEEIEPNYDVDFVVDDRRQVVNFWTDIGLKVLNVGNIYERF